VPLSRLRSPIRQLRSSRYSIDHNAKGKALLKALGIAMKKAVELGAETEGNHLYRITSHSKLSFACASGTALGKTASSYSTGSNTDDGSKAIYAAWLDVTRAPNRYDRLTYRHMRSALVDYFRGRVRS